MAVPWIYITVSGGNDFWQNCQLLLPVMDLSWCSFIWLAPTKLQKRCVVLMWMLHDATQLIWAFQPSLSGIWQVSTMQANCQKQIWWKEKSVTSAHEKTHNPHKTYHIYYCLRTVPSILPWSYDLVLECVYCSLFSSLWILKKASERCVWFRSIIWIPFISVVSPNFNYPPESVMLLVSDIQLKS